MKLVSLQIIKYETNSTAELLIRQHLITGLNNEY